MQNSQQNVLSFLDLPADIRHRIYNAAGLVIGANLRLVPRKIDAGYLDWQPSAESFHFTYNILQTCKAINSEVIGHICSQNTLVVCEHVHYGLEFLRRLNPQQCSALADLFVQLRLEAPVLGDDFTVQQRSPSLDSALIASWQAAARHILSHTRPRTLHLRLFCDTGVSDATYAILQPLKDFPGVLKDCELQLHHQRGDTRARAMARDTCARAKGLDPDLRARPFRFFDLPAEIRRRILEYSDLATPFQEVYWSANRGFRIASARIRCGGDECDAYIHRGCRFLFCESEQLDSAETGYICCRRRSGYSSRCQCWEAPRALFLVSQAFYREALQVLYSCNRVIVVPSKGLRSSLGPDETATRLDASRFITRHMWPDVLRDLRAVEFVLPAMDPATAEVSGEPYYSDFCFAIDHLKAHADIPKLTMVLSITSTSSVTTGDEECIHRELTKSGGNEALALRSYAQLFRCLEGLRGMRRFFVHLEWAWHWAVKHPQVGLQNLDALNAELNRMESWLEKMVMGDNYDNEAAGKNSEQPGVWQYVVWNMLEHLWWSGLSETQLLNHI
ncbi:hypothetical protein GGR52DRAFT_180839 [Hypoxylon sp. FL1284]|nr:hypothetical protein GGR52DRAFT_180839 [Hypoxylon sp. FL1284]